MAAAAATATTEVNKGRSTAGAQKRKGGGKEREKERRGRREGVRTRREERKRYWEECSTFGIENFVFHLRIIFNPFTVHDKYFKHNVKHRTIF